MTDAADTIDTTDATDVTDAGTGAVRLARYTKADLVEILGEGDDPFGVDSAGLTWLPKEEHFGIRLRGRLVAHAGLRTLPLVIGGAEAAETQVVGVGGVAVAPDVRGRGLARQVVGAALAQARTMGPQHALLFCRPPLVALYRRLGWQPVEAEVRVEQPGERVVTMPLPTMVTPLRADARWPAGPVRLLSLPM
ncbi:GNAT family N-acetyltransferase [Streptomyces monticola]|uniref:GNAT family N-acetyltransferase n=1 Tax=Streptomyces monticola TaxID=2666263 RepID=A0ABW2JXC6_9ACTN